MLGVLDPGCCVTTFEGGNDRPPPSREPKITKDRVDKGRQRGNKMSDASPRKSGAATPPSPDEEALHMPLGKRSKERPPAAEGRKEDAARRKPGIASAPPSRPAPPSPPDEAKKG